VRDASFQYDDRLPRGEVIGTAVGSFGVLARMAGLRASRPLADGQASAGQGPLDPKAEAAKIAFDRIGSGEKVLLIVGFPQTQLEPADPTALAEVRDDPGRPAELRWLRHPRNARDDRECRQGIPSIRGGQLGAPRRAVAHDFDAWIAYSRALQFPGTSNP
jgi:hypothetical protein